MTLAEKIEKQCSCPEVKAWLSQYNEGEEQKAWDECERGDLMFRLLNRLIKKENRKTLFEIANNFVNSGEPLENPEHEMIRQNFLEVTKSYSDGKVTAEDVKVAVNTALMKICCNTDDYPDALILKEIADKCRENYPKAPQLI